MPARRRRALAPWRRVQAPGRRTRTSSRRAPGMLGGAASDPGRSGRDGAALPRPPVRLVTRRYIHKTSRVHTAPVPAVASLPPVGTGLAPGYRPAALLALP